MGDSVFSRSKGAPKRAQDGSEKIVELRKRGFTLQEIADAVGNSRLGFWHSPFARNIKVRSDKLTQNRAFSSNGFSAVSERPISSLDADYSVTHHRRASRHDRTTTINSSLPASPMFQGAHAR